MAKIPQHLSLIHENSTFTNIQKCYYLQSTLTGDAVRVTETFDFSEAKYEYRGYPFRRNGVYEVY